MNTDKTKILEAIRLLEAQRAILGDAAVDSAIATLKQNLVDLELGINSETLKASSLNSDEGERKLVTIMFADFSNFTSMSEKMDAEEVRDVMNQCFSLLVPIIEKYGGVIDKYIGDEIMALFGAPYTHDNDAECALRASLDMMVALRKFNEDHDTNLGLHFGINTGRVIAGGVGSIHKQQYSVMGDSVNLAARLEDVSKTGEILVGYETYVLTNSQFDFDAREPIIVKGKEKPVPIYQLLKVKKSPLQMRGIEGLNSKMVGREKEFDQLSKIIEQLKLNHGAFLSIIGDPGLGKSRLLNELKKANSQFNFYEGRGLSYAQNISYDVIKRMLDEILNIQSDLESSEIKKILNAKLDEWNPLKKNEIFPYICRIRDIPLEGEIELMMRAIPSDVMQQRMRQSFGEMILWISQQQSIVLVWEDLHWADHSSLQLIEHLFSLTLQNPILMILAFRPNEGNVQEYHKSWKDNYSTYTSLVLSPLDERFSYELIDNLLKINNFPASTRKVLLEKSEGNPFFIEELIRSLFDLGLLHWEDGAIQCKEGVENIQIPNTLQGVIEARIDRLEKEEKLTLQAASVIGRIFGKQILQFLLENQNKKIDLEPAILQLQDRELIRQQVLYEYIFKHAVTQDVTYQSLLLSRRRELHLYAAEAIENLFSSQINELSHVLAWHYQRTNNHQKALH